VEYKYVTSRKIAFNHSLLGSNWGGMETKTVGPFHYYDICPDLQQNQEKLSQPGEGVNVQKIHIGL
jgi:hypothetical protein